MAYGARFSVGELGPTSAAAHTAAKATSPTTRSTQPNPLAATSIVVGITAPPLTPSNRGLGQSALRATNDRTRTDPAP